MCLQSNHQSCNLSINQKDSRLVRKVSSGGQSQHMNIQQRTQREHWRFGKETNFITKTTSVLIAGTTTGKLKHWQTIRPLYTLSQFIEGCISHSSNHLLCDNAPDIYSISTKARGLFSGIKVKDTVTDFSYMIYVVRIHHQQVR